MSTVSTKEKINYPTYEGELRYPPDGYFGELPCTCTENCRLNCKGECGCLACAACYEEYKNNGH